MAQSLGRPHVSAEFPGRAAEDVALRDLTLHDYVDHVTRQIAGLPTEGVVVVAHSLGGVVGLKVADNLGDRLRGFVGVSAAIPLRGGSFVSAFPGPKRLILGAIIRLFGTKPAESAIRKGLCNDLSDDMANEVVRRFIPESKAVYFERSGASAPAVRKMYVQLANDQEFDQPTQHAMADNLHADRVVELATGHLPMLSSPEELARVLENFADELG
jgi:pimeloyl-ACP methyl ester carboxylesterase